MTRAGWIIVATVAIAVAAAGGWAASAVSDAEQAASDARADTADCRRLADQIAAARRSPTTGPADDIGARLARAQAAADLTDEELARVAAQPVRPDGRRSTQVALQRVTLRQALSFVTSLVGDGGGPTLESFHLTVPPAGGGPNATAAGDDEWDVDLSVSTAGR